MKNIKTLCLLVLNAFFLYSCATDVDDYVETPLESILEKRIEVLYGSKESLVLPASDNFSKIPNDIKNILTEAKVELGKMLFHETFLGKNPNNEEGMNTYSCASCHHAVAGFQSGILQGIGEGGVGFGLHGEGRVKSTNYLEIDLDVQPIRSPSVLNVAYQNVMLWNGQFGGVGENLGTEDNWTVDTPKEINNLGFEGVETQAIAGLNVHRLVIDHDFIVNSSYKAMFDNAFSDVDESDRYSTTNAGLAISAYERTLLSKES